MAEELHTPDNELPISSTVGWMQMELLLNKNLPVKKRPASIRLLFACLPALLCSIFLFSFLQLGQYFFHAAFINNTQLAYKDQVGTKSTLPINNNNQLPSNIHAAVKKNYADFTFSNSAYFPVIVKNKLGGDMPGRTGNQNFIKYIPEKKAGINIDLNALAGFNNQLNFSVDNERENKNPGKKPWEFSAGLGINIAEGKSQNLQPYPVAEFRYNVSSRFFVTGGLSFLSPKAGSISGISKTVYVNDTVNNISLYNEVVSYDRWRYVDVPVSVGVNISKKIMLQTGVQLSVLVSKQQKKFLQPYDFQMNNVDLPFTAPLVGMAASPQEDFNVRVPNMDYRFIAGIKYKFKRTTAGLFYQQGLQSPDKGNSIDKTSNQLFTLSLLYQIK